MLTIIEAEHQSATLYARVVQASAASGELVIPGEPTDEQIRAAANCQLAAPEIGDYSHYVVVWDNKTIKDKNRRQNPIRVTQALGEFTPAVSAAAAVMGRKGGSARSEAKTAAVRENGRKGGRPKKTE